MGYNELSDVELWRYHQEGDIRAYNVLFQRYADFLCKKATKWMKSNVDSEELVMNILLNLWLKRDGLNQSAGNNLKAYLTRALRNHVINYFQRCEKKARVIIELKHNTLMDSRSADYIVQSKELEEMYQNKISLLSPQRLRVFKLSREEGLTYKEIAKQLNLSINTVENYMASALSKLRESE